MSERMTPLPIRSLLGWLTEEYAHSGTIFGVHRLYRSQGRRLPLLGGTVETPFGPAAGPNSQMAQNIIAAYAAGGRFFELKTVQQMDGADLAACVLRPCILAHDEGYNQEWSTELTVPQAMEEYIKAWCVLQVISRAYGLGDPQGIVFNMSVGYDLEGIRSPKVDTFIEGLRDARTTVVWQDCLAALQEFFPQYACEIEAMNPHVSGSVTLSTLHGCPPEQIEAIASYLLREKGLHTFVKCNPTLLGYDTARSTLDAMGYGYVVFDDHHFRSDLQWSDAVPMFRRLQALADSLDLEFGLKLSNTFPVDTTRGELPGQEMYMSGRSLFPLTVELCHRISRAFGGKMRLSYAGGADAYNCRQLFAAGVWPITVATTILKPGGYNRLEQMVHQVEALPYRRFHGTDTQALCQLARDCRTDPHYTKPHKPLPNRKNGEKVPWLDCFIAPCSTGCPIGQDIPAYMELVRRGRYAQALEVILRKNPLPFLTGTLCPHTCQDRCSRHFYDSPVAIRESKLQAAREGYDALLPTLHPARHREGIKAAIVGGGPTGIAAAFFLARAGVETTIFERNAALGGVPRYVIPAFRISDELLDRDISLMQRLGVTVRCGAPAPSVTELKNQGYTHILLATGAWRSQSLSIPGNVVGALEWLRDVKAGKLSVSGSVVVVGGGNTAMDAARLARRSGADRVTILYRRTRAYMPAHEEELQEALAEGVELVELAAPLRQEQDVLVCEKMALGAPDAAGRRRPEPTGETFTLPCQLVISAVGQQPDQQLLEENGITLTPGTVETNVPGVYTAGDLRRGGATIVEGIADAAAFAACVLGSRPAWPPLPQDARITPSQACERKGLMTCSGCQEGERCLQCSTVCENCVDSCPNRANVSLTMDDGRRQILHIDRLCNECGNCTQFCPYDSRPSRDKLTLFHTPEDMDDSANPGVLFLSHDTVRVRLFKDCAQYDLTTGTGLPPELHQFLLTLRDRYGYLLA